MSGLDLVTLIALLQGVLDIAVARPSMGCGSNSYKDPDILGRIAMVDRNFIANRISAQSKCKMVVLPFASRKSRKTAHFLCENKHRELIQQFLSDSIQCRHLNFSVKYRKRCFNKIYSNVLKVARNHCQPIIWKSKSTMEKSEENLKLFDYYSS